MHAPTPDTAEAALERLVYFFEHLQAADVARLADIYTADAFDAPCTN